MRTTVLALGLSALAGLAAVPAAAGDLNTPRVSPGMSWSPTACVRPIAPAPASAEYDATVLNMRVTTYNRFAADAEAYMACVTRESLADRTAVQQAIEESELRIKTDMIAEVERARRAMTAGSAAIR